MKHRNIGCRKWIVGVVLLASSGGFAERANAQPLQGQGMPNWQNMTPDQVQQMLQNMPPEQQQQVQQMLQMMTPQQQQQMLQNMPPAQKQKVHEMFEQAQVWLQDRLQKQRWDWIRQTLVASGYTDTSLQDAVLAFMQEQEKIRQPFRSTAQELTSLLVKPATPEEEFKTQLADFRDKMKKDEERYSQALAALDEKIKYSTQPRLETLLTVLGILGREIPTLGGVGTLFPNSPLGNLRGTR